MSITTELIKELRGMSAAYMSDYREKNRTSALFDIAADTIEELSTKLHAANMERSSQYYHDGWILCEERLPEERQSVLVYCPYRENIFCAYLYEGKWLLFGAYTNQIIENVTAWRSLPEPYQPNDEEVNR